MSVVITSNKLRNNGLNANAPESPGGSLVVIAFTSIVLWIIVVGRGYLAYEGSERVTASSCFQKVRPHSICH